jgi:hypothetical protein
MHTRLLSIWPLPRRNDSVLAEVSDLLGIEPAVIAGITFDAIIDTALPLGQTQDDLVNLLRDHQAVDEDAVGIHWQNRNSDTSIPSIPRYSRALFYHYPPTGTVEHFNAAGDGTCATNRILACAVNDAMHTNELGPLRFADMWDGTFDLMPVPQDIGYNFGRDYYNNLVPISREEYDQAQIRILTSFFLVEIRLGRTGCRCLPTGVEPINRWPSLIERAARAANLIAMSFGYDHYDVTIPSFNDEALVTPYSFTTPETVGGPLSNMSQEYRDAVAEGRRIWGRMGYAAVINRLIEIWDCTYEQAKTIFGQMGYAGRVNRVMRDRNLSEEDARSRIGRDCYSATILAIMGFFGCSIEKARSMFSEMGSEARRIKDGRKECRTEGCKHLQATLNNPLCQQCTSKEARKRKSGEIEIKTRHCLMCGKSEDDRTFKGKTEYCKSCYNKPEGKEHRNKRKAELFVPCKESGCNCRAYKDGKCETCYYGRR